MYQGLTVVVFPGDPVPPPQQVPCQVTAPLQSVYCSARVSNLPQCSTHEVQPPLPEGRFCWAAQQDAGGDRSGPRVCEAGAGLLGPARTSSLSTQHQHSARLALLVLDYGEIRWFNLFPHFKVCRLKNSSSQSMMFFSL